MTRMSDRRGAVPATILLALLLAVPVVPVQAAPLPTSCESIGEASCQFIAAGHFATVQFVGTGAFEETFWEVTGPGIEEQVYDYIAYRRGVTIFPPAYRTTLRLPWPGQTYTLHTQGNIVAQITSSYGPEACDITWGGTHHWGPPPPEMPEVELICLFAVHGYGAEEFLSVSLVASAVGGRWSLTGPGVDLGSNRPHAGLVRLQTEVVYTARLFGPVRDGRLRIDDPGYGHCALGPCLTQAPGPEIMSSCTALAPSAAIAASLKPPLQSSVTATLSSSCSFPVLSERHLTIDAYHVRAVSETGTGWEVRVAGSLVAGSEMGSPSTGLIPAVEIGDIVECGITGTTSGAIPVGSITCWTSGIGPP